MTDKLMATCWTHAGEVRPLDDPEVSPLPIEQRVAAVAGGGWDGIGFAQADLEIAARTIGFEALAAQIRQAGLQYVEVELLANWWLEPELWWPSWDLLSSAATTLGARTMKLGTSFGTPVTDLTPFVKPARALARDAADLGFRLALEPLPFALVGSIPQGAQLARDVDHPAFGLCVDAWHVFRADTSLDELAECLSADLVVSVELDDADQVPVGSLFEDTRDRRRYPGEGTFDLRGFIDVLRRAGFAGPWGVEMLSDAHRALPLAESLRRARDAALNVLSSPSDPSAPSARGR
jgi:sugar phosphate isomerase/epimerase